MSKPQATSKKNGPSAEARARLAAEPPATWEAIGDLRRWKDNPRRNAHVVERTAASMLEHGFGAPLVARKANKELIAGDTRIQAAALVWSKKPGEKILGVEVRPIKGIPVPGFLPVRLLDVDEETAHRLARADNKIGELAAWDTPKLLAQIEADRKLDAGAPRLQGFSDAELKKLLKKTGSPDGFPRVGADITVTHTCPKCGYSWS